MPYKFNIPAFLFRRRSHMPLPKHSPRLCLPVYQHPRFVRRCAVTQHIIHLFKPLQWDAIPPSLANRRTGYQAIPLSAYVGAFLVKIEYQLRTFGQLHRFLSEHPALLWALGFPFEAHSSVPLADRCILLIQQHVSRKLASIPNEIIQNLLDDQVLWLQKRFGSSFGSVVSIDTKHILAFVKENNPKQFVEGRFDKNKQPNGDSDCKLGCKRSKNQLTPSSEGEPASNKRAVGDFYWGYASGAVVTKVPNAGEFVLAEMTRTFDHSDITYFLPLMTQVENRLGFRPPYGTADAAFDSFYVFDYFHSPDHDGFAAVPLRNTGTKRFFNKDGFPVCEADLPMSLKGTFINRTSLVQHERARYACPLLHPEQTADACPVNHTQWPKGGCKFTMSTSSGARIRHQLDRESDRYKDIFAQRTAVERIFSQAVALGIERPKLRNQRAIANHNTLIYILINLRAMQRLDTNEK